MRSDPTDEVGTVIYEKIEITNEDGSVVVLSGKCARDPHTQTHTGESRPGFHALRDVDIAACPPAR